METDAPETFRGIFMHPLPLLNGKSAESYEEQGPLSTDMQNNTSKVIASMNIT